MHVNNSADNIAFYLTINILNTTFPPLTHPFPCSKQKRARARNDFTWSQNLVGFYCSSGSCLNSNFPLFILYRDRLLSIALRVDLPYSVDLLISVLPGKCTYDYSVRRSLFILLRDDADAPATTTRTVRCSLKSLPQVGAYNTVFIIRTRPRLY